MASWVSVTKEFVASIIPNKVDELITHTCQKPSWKNWKPQFNPIHHPRQIHLGKRT